jgi:hypothetical protein
MKWSEIGLLLLAVAAVAGFFIVVTSSQQPISVLHEETEESDEPLDLLEGDLSSVIYGPGFREVPAAPPDTIVRSMDLVDSISLHHANLIVSRALRTRGFDHVITYRIPDRGLSFVCHTPEGQPLRLELNNTRL